MTSRLFQRPFFLLLGLSLFGLSLFALVPATKAHELGTPAWVISDADLLSGPGVRYDVVSSVTKGSAIVVSRCSDRWCLVDGGDGWLSIDKLSFGQAARGPLSGPKFDIGRGGPGKVCFYDGANYSGKFVCQPSGGVARDLALLGWDNVISSVSIEGDVSVNLCRDRDFTSLCTLIAQSTPNLDPLLQNAASSWQVW